MSIIDTLLTRWKSFLATDLLSNRSKLLEMLCKVYLDEAEDVARLTFHAQQMYYPQFRERLLRIAAEEQANARWLREKIIALGGSPPQASFTPEIGRNSWEYLRLDLEGEKHDDAELMELVRMAERIDPEIAEGLRRIRKEEQRHHAEILDMHLKSEPYTVPHPATLSAEMEKQKQAWLEQQKMDWLDKRRAEWEAEGKPIPWAEWYARREYEWIANQLPNRELAWTRHLAEQKTIAA